MDEESPLLILYIQISAVGLSGWFCD